MKLHRLLRDQQGMAAVEFALVAPVLLLIVFSTIEYGWYMVQSLVLNNAVAESARAGVKAREWEDAEAPKTYAQLALKESLWIFTVYPADHVDIEILDSDENNNNPRRLSVLVSDVPYEPITGYLGENLLPKTLAAKAVLAFP